MLRVFLVAFAASAQAFAVPAPSRAQLPQQRANSGLRSCATPATLSDSDLTRVALETAIDGSSAPEQSELVPSGPQPLLMRIRGGRTLSPSTVTLLGAVVNIALSLLKFVVGTLSGSVSLVADAYHSGSDLLVDAVTMLAVNAPPAFERAATFAIAGLLATTGFGLVWSTCQALWRRAVNVEMLAAPPLLVAVVAIASKEALFRITRAVGRRTNQAVLLASAKHHRSDALSSLAAAVGAAGVLVGLPITDTLAAGLVGGMMVTMAVDVARGDH